MQVPPERKTHMSRSKTLYDGKRRQRVHGNFSRFPSKSEKNEYLVFVIVQVGTVVLLYGYGEIKIQNSLEPFI